MSEKKENPVMSFIDTKLIPVSQRIADNKYIKCLAGGSMSLMAIILIGAVFNLLIQSRWAWFGMCLPIAAYLIFRLLTTRRWRKR